MTAPAKPTWAKTSAIQDADAQRRGIPVALEVDLGGGESLKFVWIPPGTFTMGSPASEEGHFDDESQHEVELTRGFYLSIHEVTNGQYRRLKADHASGEYKGESLDGATQPVVLVSHDEATSYVAWLNGRGSGTFRLPTESEWEYACRAGTSTSRWWGDGAEGARGRASVLGPSTKQKLRLPWDAFAFEDGHHVTSPVGRFGANPWGLYDMLGNVWEWCSGWCGAYPSGRVTDPQGPSSSAEGRRVLLSSDEAARVQRGGSWSNEPRCVRAAFRSWGSPDNRHMGVGFRVVLSAPSSTSAVSGPP